MFTENEAVRAIRALRLLRDNCDPEGLILGEEYDRLIRTHLRPLSTATTNLDWPAELISLLLKAQLILVIDITDKKPRTAEMFEKMHRQFGMNQYKFSLAPHFADLKRVLGFSGLRDLELRADPNAIHVSPVYGPPPTAHLQNIFVLMPFAASLRQVYDYGLVPVSAQLGLTIARADDMFATRTVMQKVWGAIYAADLIIADCTGRNANVFYELGMAHTAGKKTIILAQDIKDVPHDIQQFEYILYENTPEGMNLLGEQLHFVIKQLIDIPLMPDGRTP